MTQGTYRGKEVGEMTKEELIEALKVMSGLYVSLLNTRLEETNL